MDDNDPPALNHEPGDVVKPEKPAFQQVEPIATDTNIKQPKSKMLVRVLRFMIIAGGLFAVFIVGMGISFSACFTIKGPPPPQCGPVSFISLVLMPGASLLFLIPLAKKIK